MGFAFVQNKNFAEADRCYDKALALDPDFQQALLNKAGLYNYQGKKKEAAGFLRRILRRDPGNEAVKQVLGTL